MIITKIDRMIELLQKNKRMKFRDIAKELNWNVTSVERILLILESTNKIKTHYPITMIQAPLAIWVGAIGTEHPAAGTAQSVQNTQNSDSKSEVSGSGSPETGSGFSLTSTQSSAVDQPNTTPETQNPKPLEEYDICAHGAHTRGKVIISYSMNEKRPTYALTLDELSEYAKIYLEVVKTEVAAKLGVSAAEVSKEDTERTFTLRHKMIADTLKMDLEEDEETIDRITDIILNEMYSLGKIEALIGDEKLEEIVMNSSKQPISVYHRKLGWLKTNILLQDESEIENYAEQIARRVGRQISILNPILDAHLGTGDRVNATLLPISAHGNTITMRLFARNPWTMISYLKPENNSMSYEMAALLWQGIQYEMNILIAGGTASGKTSALNGILALIQPFQRIVTIEDTRELILPSYQWNWVPMVTRQPNLEGVGEVTMLDLVVNALRMRPDRIVMGEIRRKKEAEVLFEAMHTGHSVYSTIHADTGAQVVKRLTEPPIEIPAAEVEDLHLVVVQYRDRRKNVRRTLEISELLPGEGTPELNRLFNWKPRTDTFQLVKSPRRYIEQMNLHTGMTEREVQSDQNEKVVIMKWMNKYGLDKVEDVGRVMKEYYANPAEIFKAAEMDTIPDKVL